MSFGFEEPRLLRRLRVTSRHRSQYRAFAILCVTALSVLFFVGCAAEPVTANTSETTQATPKPEPTPEPTAAELRHAIAVSYVDSLSLRQQVASVIMANTSGTDPQMLADFTSGNELGGFLLMGSNIPESPETLAALTAGLHGQTPNFPRLIAIDEEGGEVTRIPWDVHPGASQLRSLPTEDTNIAFANRAELLRAAGINVNFGIIADVESDPHGFIYWRTFGDTPQTAAERVVAAVSGEQGTVASTLKHFPGHGSAAGDSHWGIPQSLQEFTAWETEDGVPFIAGIDAGAELLMFGHLSFVAVDPLPASLSPEWHRIVREDLGFTGVTISDDLGMLLNSGLPEYTSISVIASQALAAGADMALMMQGVDPGALPQIIDQIAASVDADGPTHERLREAAIRVAELRLIIGERTN